MKNLAQNTRIRKILLGVLVGLGVATGVFVLTEAQYNELLTNLLNFFQ